MTALIQQQIDKSPDFTLPYHMALRKELSELVE
jgi:hypothetical protein